MATWIWAERLLNLIIKKRDPVTGIWPNIVHPQIARLGLDIFGRKYPQAIEPRVYVGNQLTHTVTQMMGCWRSWKTLRSIVLKPAMSEMPTLKRRSFPAQKITPLHTSVCGRGYRVSGGRREFRDYLRDMLKAVGIGDIGADKNSESFLNFQTTALEPAYILAFVGKDLHLWFYKPALKRFYKLNNINCTWNVDVE